jgi:hypothetical protein
MNKQSQEQDIYIDCRAGHRLVGTLLLPHQAQLPVPVVVIVHGASGQLRSDYQNFADAFVLSGMGVFIYDKRGWGESTGDEGRSDIYRLADDLVDVITDLQVHPAVSCLGLCGFSNGGWVAPLAAARVEGSVQFLIACSASGVSPARQERYRRGVVAADQLGANPEQVARIRDFWEHAFALLATGNWTVEFEQQLEALKRDEEIQALPKEEGMPDGLLAVPSFYSRERWKIKGGTAPHMLFDAVPVFRSLSIPILSIWGELDTVIPLQESINVMREGMKGHQDYTSVILPQVGHMLTISAEDTRLPAEMQKRMTQWAWEKA